MSVSVGAAAPTGVLPMPSGGAIPEQDPAMTSVVLALAQAVSLLAQSVSLLVQSLASPGVALAQPGGASVGLPSGTIDAAGAPAALQSTQPATSAAPTSAAAPRPSHRRGAADGPGVDRRMLSANELERSIPAVRGNLTPPTGAAPPKGVSVRTNGDGTRVVTINIHAAVPAHEDRGTRNESMDGLRDIASYINSIDPDVVMVQEIRNRPMDAKLPGITQQTSVLAHLIGASDMAFTPSQHSGGAANGTGIFTRNGYTIERAVNARLRDVGDPTMRSAGIAVVQPPDGRPAFSVISTHLSHQKDLRSSQDRHDQLAELARITQQIEQGGSFTYETVDGRRATASGFPSSQIILGGDLNTTQQGKRPIDSADDMLAPARLRHANDLVSRGRRASGGIDHIYVHGYDATMSVRAGVARRELRSDDATDHHGYITQLRS